MVWWRSRGRGKGLDLTSVIWASSIHVQRDSLKEKKRRRKGGGKEEEEEEKKKKRKEVEEEEVKKKKKRRRRRRRRKRWRRRRWKRRIRGGEEEKGEVFSMAIDIIRYHRGIESEDVSACDRKKKKTEFITGGLVDKKMDGN
jgi:hypothetical protein